MTAGEDFLLRLAFAAWDSVKESTLRNCFRKAGWKKADVVQPDTEPDTEFVCSEEDDEDNLPLAVLRERLNLPDSMSFDDYDDVDKDVETSETVTEQTILADFPGGHV